uniref:Secreted protein n=1 Tax=Anopheles atroparvus TaxID=41427 RepID=A0AAG5DL78_ANOAO
MRTCWRTVLAFALLGCHVVRGDFGIPPAIDGATAIQQYATNVINQASEVENSYGNIPLDGPVPAFNEAGEALKAVYQRLVDLLNPIAQSLRTLAVNDVGPVETLFGDTDSKIATMQTFITNASPALLATVQAKVSVNVRNELFDILTSINGSLGSLKSSLTALRTGVINARTAAASNGGVYTSSNIQNNVKSTLVFSVQTAATRLQANLPSAMYSAQESVRTITEANQFVETGVRVASGDSVNELWEVELLRDYQRIVDFNGELEALVNSELPLVTDRLGMFAADFGVLVGPLGTQYGEVASVFGQIVAGTELNVLNGYKTLTKTATGFIAELLVQFFQPIEPVIRRLAEILVQRTPYADYCYATFYPKVLQYLLSGEMTVSSCLDIELGRAKALMEALLEVIYELQFFLEDTNEYLHICYRLSLFDEQLASECLQEHSDFSEVIPCTAIKEYAVLLQLLCKEVDSIRFRLWACMSRDAPDYPILASQLLTDIETCRISGPFSPV